MNIKGVPLLVALNLLSLVLFIHVTTPRVHAQAAQTQKAQPVVSDYLSPQESEIINEINLARTRPQEYANYLEQFRNYYVGKELRRPGQAAELTNEGASALEEAIRFLRGVKALPPLGVARGMCLAARDHVKDLEQTDGAGHTGSNGSITEDRLKRYGSWNSAVGENIAYSSTAAREIVIGWIIDDGTASRGHRQAIFNPSFSTTGIATGKSTTYGPLCVSVFSDGFRENAPAAANSANAPAQKPKTAARRF